MALFLTGLSLHLSLFAGASLACQRDLHLDRHHSRHAQDHALKELRQAAPFPPVLTDTESLLVNSFEASTIDEWAYYYTHGLHLAGTNKTMAQWTADKFTSFGVAGSLAEYWTFLNYPVSTSLSVNYPNGESYEATLTEQGFTVDETTTYPNSVSAFHGLSWSGNVSAEYVYVGRGQQVDFNRLKELGVALEGKIALAKYGGPFRGLKVKNAQDNGMVGCVIFTDPGDDGEITEANGYLAYPDGPARNPTSIQRGSVQFLSIVLGDPTTPGYPSKQDSPRVDTSLVTPRIPSLPMSWKDAVPFLSALDGYGSTGVQVNRTGWIGGIGNVTYSTGPAPGTTLSLSNVNNDTITPIWNAIGIINGTNPDETIVIGNHRDAWIVGGAGDPNSGTAVLVELSKALGKLLATGWRPRRNIVLGSWDGEEYGIYGSTEWVEEYIPWLNRTAIAYLNVDIATTGPHVSVGATPEMHAIIAELMKKILWPSGNTGVLNSTMYDSWTGDDAEFEILGSGSDYVAFLHNGIGSVDLASYSGASDPVWHYHSNYDTYHWMTTYGDPGFVRHRAVGQFLSLLAYHLADDPIIPFDIPNYTTQMRLYFEDLVSVVAAANATGTLDLLPLADAIDAFDTAATGIAAVASEAAATGDEVLASRVNTKYRDFQRGFASQGGLPGRASFYHVVFAPGIDTGYAPVTFPGVTEAVEAGNLTLATSEVQRAAAAIKVAAAILVLQ